MTYLFTADDFNIVHGSKADKDKFTEALVYLQQSGASTQYLQALKSQHIEIWIFSQGDTWPPGDTSAGKQMQDVTRPPAGVGHTNRIYWAPNEQPETILHKDDDVGPSDMSPALSFIHEAIHATDPLLWSDPYHIPVPDYTDRSEQIAINAEHPIAKDLKEYQRVSHQAKGLKTVGSVGDNTTYTQYVGGIFADDIVKSHTDFSGDHTAIVQTVIQHHNLSHQFEIDSVYAGGLKGSVTTTVSSSPTGAHDGVFTLGHATPIDYGKSIVTIDSFGGPNHTLWLYGTRKDDSNWADGSGTTVSLINYKRGQFAPAVAVLTGGLIAAGNKIVINQFDVFAAETYKNGFFGVRLQGVIKITSNALAFTLSIDGASAQQQVFHVHLSSPALYKDFLVSANGAKPYQINSDGSFDVVLDGKQTFTTFRLLDATGQTAASDIAKGVKFTISASLADQYNAGGRTISGVSDEVNYFGKTNLVHVGRNFTEIRGSSGYYAGDGGNDEALAGFVDDNIQFGNSANDNIVGGTGSNVIVGGSGNTTVALVGTSDAVTLGSGHSSVDGSSGGHDTIRAPGQSSLINAHNGTDVILAGSGRNQIYADTQISLPDAIASADSSIPNAQRANLSSQPAGANSSTVASGATHQKGDLISVLDGDDTVVSGLGDDLVNAGSGHSVVVLGPGQDTFIGGWEVTAGLADLALLRAVVVELNCD